MDKATLQDILNHWLADAQVIEAGIKERFALIEQRQAEIAQLQTQIHQQNGALAYIRRETVSISEQLKQLAALDAASSTS